jgi:hypothetical protein
MIGRVIERLAGRSAGWQNRRMPGRVIGRLAGRLA